MRKVISRIQLFKDPGSIFGNQVEGYLDVKESTELPLNLSIGDIRDISKRTGSFSKTIKLSGSKNNNILLNNYFEVNIKASDNFNLNKKQRCAIIQNGVVVLDNCYLRLIKTKKVQSHSPHIDELVEYEVEVRDSVGDFFNEINNKELSDLNLDEFNHVYNNVNIINSFTHSSDEGYSYTLPWIGNDNSYSVQELVPGFFAKTYWDKIHSEAGFLYDWGELSDSNVKFDKLFIPFSGDKKKLSEEDKDFNEVIADNPSVVSTPASVLNVNGSNLGPGYFNQVPWFHTLTPNEIKDNNNLFNDSTSVYNNPFVVTTPDSLVYEVKINFDLIMQNDNAFNTVLIGNQVNTFSPRLRVRNQVNTSKGISSLSFNTLGPSATVQNVCEFSNSNKTIRFKGTAFLGATNPWLPGDTLVANGDLTTTLSATDLNIGEQLRLGIEGVVTQAQGVFWNKVGEFEAAYMKPKFRINSIEIKIVPSSDNGILPGTPLSVNQFIPKKVKQNDFIKSIIQKYNLYVEIDKFDTNRLIYKSRDKYYDEGELKDWTYKLAKDKEQFIDFVPEIKNKRTILSYKDDSNDGLLETYRNEVGETYGQIEVIFDNENTRGLERKDEIFSPTMNLYSDFGANLPVLNPDFKFNIRVLLHNGVRSCAPYNIIESSSNITNINYYPFISMLDEPTNPNFDISYGINDYYPYDIVNFTSNNLYTNFWRRTFAQINSGKMMTAYFWLNEEDIFKLKLSDKIKVNNALWYINKIIDYKANKNVLTKVELLSVEDDLRLPRFGRIIKPNVPGTTGPFLPGPVKPVGPVRPIVDAVSDVIRKRSIYTSVYNGYSDVVNLGNRNVINTDSAFVIGDDLLVEERGYFVDDTSLVSGGLKINENIGIDTTGIYWNDYTINESGFGLNTGYVLDGYIDDGYFISPTTASIDISYDDIDNETTINITADNVLINGVDISSLGGGATGATGATGPVGPAAGFMNIISNTASLFTITDEDIIIQKWDGFGGSIINLPSATYSRKVTIKDGLGISSGKNIRVNGDIDGDSSYIMSIDWMSITMISDGGEWFII